MVKELHPSLSDVVESRIQRAGKRHEALYEKAKESIVNNDMQQFHFYVSSMIQLDPRATYGWDTTQKASHAALKGKGENIDIEDDRNIDIGGLVRGSYDAEEFIYDRRLMMDGDYYEEDFEEDFEEDLEEDLDED